MSTVSDIVNDLKYQIDANLTPNMYSWINMAIRYIAKRLYIFGSEIITGELAVQVFETDSLTALDIAFVHSATAADTITGTAAAFITSGFQADMPITTTCSGNLGPFHVETVAAGTLTLATADVVTDQAAGASYTITSDDAYGYLPSDFWGLKGDNSRDYPYISGKDWHLIPLPSQAVALSYLSPGEPRYFRIKGMKLYVYPETSSDITIKGDYFMKPTKISAMGDTMPFDELFDDLIVEMVVALANKGSLYSKELGPLFDTMIDLIIPLRDRKGVQTLEGGINYDDYT